MISDLPEQWFIDQRLKFQKDPKYRAEEYLLSVTNNICVIHKGQPKGIYSILFWILNWSADRLIWRKKPKGWGDD